jgi:chemotaxis protein methyltransferase CheR
VLASEPETRLPSSILSEPLFEPASIQQKTPSEAAPLLEFERAKQLYDQGQWAEASALLGSAAAGKGVEPRVLILLARALANHGELIAAVAACDRVLGDDKMNPTAHYLRASILQELGDLSEAGLALKRALYLEPDFVLAHFGLGNLSRIQGKISESDRHFGNALALTQARQPDEILPEADGLTAGRLAEIICAIRSIKAVAWTMTKANE